MKKLTEEEIERAAIEKYGDNPNLYACQREGFREAAIWAQKQLEEKNLWIPVSERLPELEIHEDALFEDEVDFERSKYVFLKVKGYPHPFVGFYVREAGKCFFDLMYTANEHIRQSDITHWLPIEYK